MNRLSRAGITVVLLVGALWAGADGRAVEELGFYNPHTNETNLNITRINVRISQGAQPTLTVQNLLKKVSK